MKLKSSLLITKYFHLVLVLFVLGLLTPNHQVGATETSTTTPLTRVSSTTSVGPITAAPSPPPLPPIIEVARVSYRSSSIRIFANASTKNHNRFFYDPLVQLDPKSLTVHPHKILNRNYVSFNIILWDPELRRQVFDRVKSLNGQQFNVAEIEEKDIYVLPFVELKLYNDRTVKGTYSSQKYNREDEYLYFEIYCNSTNAANVLAEDLRRDPVSVMHKWNMTCSGLDLGNKLRKEIAYTYPISIYIPTPTAPTTRTTASTTKAPTTITMATTTTAPIPIPPSAPIIEVSKVSYRGSAIRIFADGGVTNPNRFFFEPLVQLNPKTIIAHPHGLLKWDVVSFTIEMWNSELRRQVLARVKSLKSLPNVTVEEQDVYVLPFETIQLTHGVFTTINSSVEVGMMNTSKSYLRQSESLQFYLTFNSTISANGIAENFRLNPGFVLELWNMTLVGHGLDLGNKLGKELVYRYPIATPLLSTSCPLQQNEQASVTIRPLLPSDSTTRPLITVTEMKVKSGDPLVEPNQQRVKRHTHYHQKPQYGYNYQGVDSLHYHDAATGQVVAGNSYNWPYYYYNGWPYYSPYYYYGR